MTSRKPPRFTGFCKTRDRILRLSAPVAQPDRATEFLIQREGFAHFFAVLPSVFFRGECVEPIYAAFRLIAHFTLLLLQPVFLPPRRVYRTADPPELRPTTGANVTVHTLCDPAPAKQQRFDRAPVLSLRSRRK